jgi:hypothetical protein
MLVLAMQFSRSGCVDAKNAGSSSEGNKAGVRDSAHPENGIADCQCTNWESSLR